MIIHKDSKDRPSYLQSKDGKNYHEHVAPRKTMKKIAHDK